MKKNYFLITLFLIVLGITSTVSFGQTTTFNYTGAVQTYVVPVGITAIGVDVYGAKGGDNGANIGGLGGRTQAEITVIPGQILEIYVGGQGVSTSIPGTGGWNGGGNTLKSFGSGTSGTGGGASDIRVSPYAITNRIVVAGGGGGSGYQNYAGANGGGLIGQDAAPYPSFPTSGGKGGTQVVGGAAGNSALPTYLCTPGTLFQGGTGDGDGAGSGGGGGGYYGGGGGMFCGGGGGSSYTFPGATSVVHTQGVQNGNGLIVITLLCTPLNLTVTPFDTVCFGTPVTINGTSTGTGTITWDNGITNNLAFPNNVAGVTTYTSTSTDPNDCVAQVTINVLPELTGTVSNTICNEGSVVVNGNTYDVNTPTGTEVISNVGPFNCDSTVTVNLNVLPGLTGSVTNTICNNGSVIVNGNTYDANTPTGTEVFTNVGPNNCDSTVTINLNVLAAKTGTVANAICAGDSMVINGTTYNAGNPAGTEIFTNVGPSMCDSTVIVNLTINPLPTVAIAAFTPDTVCDSDPVINLPAGTPTAGTYSGTGVVGTTFDPNTAGVGAHYVTYSFTDGNSCTNMDSTMIVVQSCVGINENGELAGVNIYPNPTNNIINISLGNITSNVNLTLTSVEGKVVYQENNVSDNKVSIDISNNSKGIYFLKVEANNKYKVYKVIKE